LKVHCEDLVHFVHLGERPIDAQLRFMNDALAMNASLSFCIVVCVLATGCANTPTVDSQAKGATSGAMLCPISGEPVTTDSKYVAYFSVYPVYCASLSDSTQFGSMPISKRSKLCAPQVLEQKGITNTTCPLTGETLTASAGPVKYEGQTIGFASLSDANQFKSLPKAQQKKIIDKWMATNATPAN